MSLTLCSRDKKKVSLLQILLSHATCHVVMWPSLEAAQMGPTHLRLLTFKIMLNKDSGILL